MLRVLPPLFLLLILAGCGALRPAARPATRTEPPPARWPDGVAYEIFVQSFADSDGDSVGDLRGVTASLDYLDRLGVRALWLMPISPSPSYHKYDVTDYLAVHPSYGTLDDARELVRAAHARNIAVVLDLVVNHTARAHPWFAAAAADPASPYRGYYVWADSAAVSGRMRGATADAGTRRPWHRAPAQAPGDGERYYGLFGPHMPDLNFDHPAVRAQMIEAARFWLRDVGVDGFRLDAAKHIYPDERAADSHAWWRTFRDSLRVVKPDVYLVGEVWDRPDVVAPYLGGLPSLFNFELAGRLTRAVRTGRADGVAERLAETRARFAQINPAFVDATFLTNHDQTRVMSVLGDSTAKARVAASLLLTLPGAPFLYYGEELGMRGRKPDEFIREPFPWGGALAARTPRWIAPRHTTADAIPTAAAQEADAASILHHYRALVALRNAHPALGRGTFEPAPVGDAAVVSFVRADGGERLWVAHNVSGRAVTVAVPEALGAFGRVLYASEPAVRRAPGVLILPPYASAVLALR